MLRTGVRAYPTPGRLPKRQTSIMIGVGRGFGQPAGRLGDLRHGAYEVDLGGKVRFAAGKWMAHVPSAHCAPLIR